MNTKPGTLNSITDVDGILVGQAADRQIQTGVTVILPETPAVCAVDIRGGGPGTKETDALSPEAVVDRVDAVVLSGGSVYGLAAADGVAASLGAQGRGFSLVARDDVPVSPIVPAAILYDLANGGNKAWGETPPYHELGKKALKTAKKAVATGQAGAGYGARAGAYPGGIGTASVVTEEGWQVGAIAAVNSFGSPYMPDSNCFWAWPYEVEEEYGGRKPVFTSEAAAGFPSDTKIGLPHAGGNTTIAVIAVNAKLTKAEAKRLAIMAQDGLSRAIRPAHAPTDGDIVFAMGTGQKEIDGLPALTLTNLGSLAADCLARAIARGVYAAEEGKQSE